MLAAVAAAADAPRVIFEPATESVQSLPNLIEDSGFERADGSGSGWRPYGKGFEFDRAQNRAGNQSIRCTAKDISSTYGAVITLHPNQKTATPLVLDLWTRNEGLEFPPSDGYALYADINYADGTRDWAQLAKCPTDSKDWQRVELLLHPTRPVESLDFYCLFRKTAGTVWFDDAACRQVDPTKVRLFDGQFVKMVNEPSKLTTTQPASWMNDLVVLVQAHDDGRIWEPTVHSQGNTVSFEVPAIGLSLDTWSLGEIYGGGRSLCRIVVQNRRNVSRAVTVFWGRALTGNGQWWDDGARTRPAGLDPNGVELANLSFVGAGKSGWVSRYPMCAVSMADGLHFLQLAPWLHMQDFKTAANSTIARVAYYPPLGMLYAAIDVVAETPADAERTNQGYGRQRYSSTIDIYDSVRAQPQSFREAWKSMLGMSKHWVGPRPLGIWAPFVKVSTIERPEDFYFAFKEGDNDTAYDEKARLLTFHYFYNQALWINQPSLIGNSYPATEKAIPSVLREKPSSERTDAEIALRAACRLPSQNLYLWAVSEPWCKGAVIAVNPERRRADQDRRLVEQNMTAVLPESSDSFRRRYATGIKLAPHVDGPFFDSVEAWADIVDYSATTRDGAFALTFDPRTRQIGVLNASSMVRYFEEWRSWADRAGYKAPPPPPPIPPGQLFQHVHTTGSFDEGDRRDFTMANGTPNRFWWFAQYFDIMGQETNWKPDNRWSPMSPEDMWYRRALCGKKPYCLLMNADFDRWTVADTRRYFMRCAAYAFLPSFFSHNAFDRNYWENPTWYNRDRPLFKQFIPVIRELARAGWEPVTRARAEAPILVERFEDGDTSPVYWTVHNPADRTTRSRVWFATAPPPSGKLRELLTASDRSYSMDGNEMRLDVELKPDETLVLRADYPPASAPAGP